MDITQAARADYLPMDGLMAKGYTDSAHWLRLEVQALPQGGPVRLRIRPTFLDDVQLYVPDASAPGGWVVRYSGDQHGFASSERGVNSLGFLVQPSAPSTTYYMRLRTTSSSVMHVEAVAPSDAYRKDAALGLLQIVYSAFITCVLFWACQAWLRRREVVIARFVAYQLANIVYAFLLMGYLAPFEPLGSTGLVDQLASLSVIATFVLGVRFHRAVMAPYAPPKLLDYGLLALQGGGLLLALAYLAGQARWALQINALCVLLLGLLLSAMAFTAKREGLPPLRLLRTIYVLHTLSILLTMLPYLGWLRAVEWSLQATLLYGAISAALMFYMQSLRSRLQAQQAETNERNASLALQQLEYERERATERGRFIDMLTHELKTPVGVALMSLGALKGDSPYLLRVRRALDNINGIVDRTRLSELAEHQRLQPELGPCNVSERVYECMEASTQPERLKASVGFGLEARTDSQLLGVVIANLIDNALKYSPTETSVDIALQAQNLQGRDGLCLRVANAVGAAGRPDPEQLFGKYYRGVGAQGKSGSGLGLHLARSLAELLGAQLTYQPNADKVVFELWLPV